MDQRAATRWSRLQRAYRARARRAGVVLPAGVLLIILVGGLSVGAAACAAEDLPRSTATSGPATLLPDSQGQTASGETGTTVGDPPVVKIGALFPLTGDLASEGESALRGMRAALQEVNDAGGISSMGGALLTLVEADSKSESENADAAVEQLVTTEGAAAVVGTGQSTVALRASAAAEHLGVPFVVSSAAADEITERDLRYTFRLCPVAAWYARDQVAFLVALKERAGLDIRSVALLHENGEFGSQTAQNQKAYLAEAGIDVVADLEYSPTQADVHTQILEIKNSGAQAVLTATFLSDAAMIAKTMALVRVSIPVVDAAGGVLDPSFADEAGAAGENLMSVAEWAQGSPSSAQLKRDLSATDAELDPDSLYGYQAVWLLAVALERAGTADAERLRAALATTALSGEHLVLPQDLLTFDGTGQNRQARLLVVQMQDGRLVTVWPEGYAQATVRLP